MLASTEIMLKCRILIILLLFFFWIPYYGRWRVIIKMVCWKICSFYIWVCALIERSWEYILYLWQFIETDAFPQSDCPNFEKLFLSKSFYYNRWLIENVMWCFASRWRDKFQAHIQTIIVRRKKKHFEAKSSMLATLVFVSIPFIPRKCRNYILTLLYLYSCMYDVQYMDEWMLFGGHTNKIHRLLYGVVCGNSMELLSVFRVFRE